MPNPPDAHLKSLCGWLAPAARTLAAGFFAAGFLLWLMPGTAEFIARSQTEFSDGPLILSLQAQIIGAVLSALHIGMMSMALWIAAELFQHIAKGETLYERIGHDLRRIGFLVCIYAIAAPFIRTLMILALTMENPPGQRFLSVSLNFSEFVVGMLGALIFVLGHVMAEAARVADDNRQIV